MKKATIRRLALRMLALCLITVSLLAGCSGSGGKSSTTAGGADNFENQSTAANPQDGEKGWAPADRADSDTAPTSPARKNAKIILEGKMDLQAQDFDEADTFLRSLTADLGGYLEATSVSGDAGNRYAEYTVRIPQEKYDGFFVQVGEKCHVRSSSSQARNVTEEYVDLEARLSAQRAKHSRLLALMEKADSMEAIIALQTELSNTEYELERLTGSLRKYDSLVDFSTVRLTLHEVRALDPVKQGNSFVSELTQAFRSGTSGVLALVRGTVLLVVTFWPLTLILAAALVIAVRRLRRARLAQMHGATTRTDKENPE